ncbi:MAG: hypothetical protein ACMG6S_00955 [Byssovorax sp.]
MIWSDDARLLRRPFVTYGELAADTSSACSAWCCSGVVAANNFGAA